MFFDLFLHLPGGFLLRAQPRQSGIPGRISYSQMHVASSCLKKKIRSCQPKKQFTLDSHSPFLSPQSSSKTTPCVEVLSIFFPLSILSVTPAISLAHHRCVVAPASALPNPSYLFRPAPSPPGTRSSPNTNSGSMHPTARSSVSSPSQRQKRKEPQSAQKQRSAPGVARYDLSLAGAAVVGIARVADEDSSAAAAGSGVNVRADFATLWMGKKRAPVVRRHWVHWHVWHWEPEIGGAR